jgi:MFS family permease
MIETRDQIVTGAEAAWATTASFLPKLGMFLVILIAGYFIAKWVAKLLDAVLEKIKFDQVVERGGIKKALQGSKYDASDILAKIAFFTMFLFVLQLAFGVFGQNPISSLLERVIAFLPNIFVAIVIVIVASAVASMVKDIIQNALGGLGYGRMLGRIAAALIVTVGVFMALNQVGIAPAIVNGIFYAGLAIIAGSAIIAIGGGGIAPMRRVWERALSKVETEAPRLKAEAQMNAGAAAQAAEDKIEAWKKPVEQPAPRAPYAQP